MKPMPANGSGPSAMLAESLAALSKSAHQALAEVENRARQDVVKANSEAREARTERDKALEALHAAQLGAQELQNEVASMKATLKHTELSASHHNETIAQLRREVTQWRDQSHNWQEHFLRVEQERCSLTTRIEGLVSERLQWSRSLPTPFTPNHPSANTILSVTSPKPRPALTSSHKHPVSPPDVDSPSTSTSTHKSNGMISKPTQIQGSMPTRKLFSHDSSSSTLNQNFNVKSSRIPQSSPRSHSRTTVLRRVHAVINVKQEESDIESEQMVVEDLVATPNSICVPPRKRKAVIYDHGDYASHEESDHPPSGSDQYSEYSDNEKMVDDEDDELMLGGESFQDNRGRASRIAPSQHLTTLPRKKRKITAGSDKPRIRRGN